MNTLDLGEPRAFGYIFAGIVSAILWSWGVFS